MMPDWNGQGRGGANSPAPETKGFNYDNYANMFCIGTTRSGKTTCFLNIIEYRIKQGLPVFIISGKIGANDKYSLFRQTEALCKKHNRKFFAFSMHESIENEFSYNAFKYTDIHGIANTMSEAIASFSEPHYQAALELHVINILELLGIAGKEFSLPNIMRVFSWHQYSAVVQELR